ncbi:phosphodiester glycosidase family protein [Paenibacillus sp.]|uniref:phosphodiester glycosidase family protein n=1 Tax=Paenibacillus sp. TaxID=58172 RepID=UPI002D5A79FE|nr:phosphodiester glycosidase family protein [Paenibacillus sp.]HZG57745.1 phosphodiester glycosidase family protein [Paenibacillus sp.]
MDLPVAPTPLTWLPRRRWTLAAVALAAAALTAAIWLWGTPSGARLRYLAADTIITTQHREWAKAVIGERALRERIAAYERRFDDMGRETLQPVRPPLAAIAAPAPETAPLFRVEDIAGEGWSGKLLVVSDPRTIRIGVPGVAGRGEKVSRMMLRLGAEAGVNGGGFADPNWTGNGFKPTGLVLSGGKVFYSDAAPEEEIDVVGFTEQGSIIAGKYTLKDILRMGVKEAVSFRPRLIVNGKGLVKSDDDGWGFAPRTAVAQTADGTVLFAVIDGRQTHSVGATLYDVQQLFLDRGAVVAANLDGGASTVLVTRDAETGFRIENKPATTEGERYLPTAFLVFRQPALARIGNVWEGLDMDKFDPAKW